MSTLMMIAMLWSNTVTMVDCYHLTNVPACSYLAPGQSVPCICGGACCGQWHPWNDTSKVDDGSPGQTRYGTDTVVDGCEFYAATGCSPCTYAANTSGRICNFDYLAGPGC